ncbi:MAG: sigma-70 family RNA polymerase sigma factor [Verrucomicrobiota bacterium]
MVERANGGEARGDEELLAGYVEAGSEAAFRGLVERYGGLVFHTAMRVTGDHELAEEAVQNTFSVLAKRARSVKGAGGLAGWLHRTAWYEAKNLRRAETRRGRKMKAYAEEGEGMEASEEDEGEGDESWREALPFLDGALERLGAKDRMVLLLHYFEGLSYGEVAERVGGVSGAGAQKRGVRALAKLGRLLRARGCVLSGVAVGSMLGVELAKAAPVGLSAKVVAGALSGVTAGAGGGGFVGMLLGGGAGKVQVAGGVAVAAILLTPIVVQQVAIVEARGRIEALEKESGVGGGALTWSLSCCDMLRRAKVAVPLQ